MEQALNGDTSTHPARRYLHYHLVEGQTIILTGAPALNNVLGCEVYTSNLQLGGTQIMYKNGVSHLVASSDLDGTTKILQWLSYVPDVKGAQLPVAPRSNTWDREIGYFPPKDLVGSSLAKKMTLSICLVFSTREPSKKREAGGRKLLLWVSHVSAVFQLASLPLKHEPSSGSSTSVHEVGRGRPQGGC